MCGEPVLANLLLLALSAVETHGLSSEPAEVPLPSYEDGFVKPGRLGAAGGGLWGNSSLPHTAHTARATTTHSSPVADKSAKWIGALRKSLMRDNYDYQPPEPETLAPLAPINDATGETSETNDSSGDTSGSTEHGRPSAQDYDRPTPRSLNNSPTSKDHSFSKARPDVNPILKPSRSAQNISRKNMYRDLGLEVATFPAPGSLDRTPSHRSTRKRQYRPGLDPVTMPPRTAANAALIDEINEQFETKRRNYLESLHELEDQLRPVYATGPHHNVDRRGGNDRGLWNQLDDANGIKSKSPPYIAHDGIRRYKVFKNEIEKLQPFVEDYLDYRNNHPEARVDAELIPWHKNPQKYQDPLTELHQEALKMKDNVKPTFVSSEYVRNRQPQRKDRFDHRSGRKGTTTGDEWYTRRHHDRHKKHRSMYLESADLPDIDSEGPGQRFYNSRRNAELLEDSSYLFNGSSSRIGLPSATSST